MSMPERPEDEQGWTHHFADATASASDQHDFTVDTEEILNVEGGHGCGFKEDLGELECRSPGIKPSRDPRSGAGNKEKCVKSPNAGKVRGNLQVRRES